MSLGTDYWRWFRRIFILGAVIVVALHVINAIRLDALDLNSGISELIDRAETVSKLALPEYQDLTLARLPPNPNNGPLYRFDDNLHLARIVDSLPQSSTGPGEFEFRLEFDDDREEQLIAADGKSDVERRDGRLIVTHRENEYLMTAAPVRIRVSNVSEIILRARADKGNRFRLLWAAEGKESRLERNSLNLDLIADGQFHTYAVNVQNAFRRGVRPDEFISVLAIEPSNVDGAKVEIDYVRLVSKLWKYQAERIGKSYESVGGELRPVLHMIPGLKLDYEVDVPSHDAHLSLGAAVLIQDQPIEASVSVVHNEESTRVFHSSNVASEHWQDELVDLARWAGEQVRVVFDVQGEAENVVFFSNPVVRSAVRTRLNVVLVLEDALRADHLSTLGHFRETSPAKTELMDERGIVFLNAHSQATKTRPSIATLMTSLYPTATGVWDFSDLLSDRYLTLAEILRAQGFETASFIQNGNAGPYAGAHQGFSTLRNEDTLGPATEDIFGERILDWLDKNQDRNFFLYLHAIDPHGVFDPPPPYDRWYREASRETVVGVESLRDASSLDPEWADTPSGEARRLLYDGEILHNDAVISRFVDELEKRNLLNDTLLILISDHGEWMGERGLWEHHPPGLRPVIHVPFMVSYPKLFDTPRRIEESVQLIDVMPTILDVASVDNGDLLMHGDSLVSLMQGKEQARWQQRVTVSEEPMIMNRNDPCTCGSLFFDEWQLHGSTTGWPHRVRNEFAKSATYRFRDGGIKPVTSFVPDLYSRILRFRTLSQLRLANMSTWRKITEGEERDLYKMDPDTLEVLRGLGYVN
jgi:arylsulfatase A-like enzyme